MHQVGSVDIGSVVLGETISKQGNPPKPDEYDHPVAAGLPLPLARQPLFVHTAAEVCIDSPQHHRPNEFT